MEFSDRLIVEVAHARPGKQIVLSLEIQRGATVGDVLRQCAMREHFPDLDLTSVDVGIFGRPVPYDRVLEPGDRVEIYRPLEADPKEVRRRLAAEGKSMGRRAQ